MGTSATTTKTTTARGVDLRLAERVLATPHLISAEKGRVILSALAPRLGIKPIVDVSLFDLGGPEEDRAGYEVVDRIAVIDVSGTLVAKGGYMDALSGVTSYQALGQALERALADREVDGILLDVDSGGGECVGCFELADKIAAARSTKPIYAVANAMAASAAYALAAATEKVFAPEVSYVGSIGVYTVHVDQSKADAEYGVAFEYVYAGARKVDGHPHGPLTDAARQATQDRVDQLYEIFVASVAQNRGLDEKAVRATEAGVFLGAQALERGLIDHVGTVENALAALKAAAKESRMKIDQIETLTSERDSARAQVATLTTERDAARAEVAKLRDTVAKFEASELERAKAGDAAYLEHLRSRSAELQAPLTADEIASVATQFELGNRAAAKSIGDTLLKLSEERGRKAGASVQKLAPGEKATKSSAQAEAEILTRKGWKVRLNDAQTEILEAIPPEKGK